MPLLAHHSQVGYHRDPRLVFHSEAQVGYRPNTWQAPKNINIQLKKRFVSNRFQPMKLTHNQYTKELQ